MKGSKRENETAFINALIRRHNGKLVVSTESKAFTQSNFHKKMSYKDKFGEGSAHRVRRCVFIKLLHHVHMKYHTSQHRFLNMFLSTSRHVN